MSNFFMRFSESRRKVRILTGFDIIDIMNSHPQIRMNKHRAGLCRSVQATHNACHAQAVLP